MNKALSIIFITLTSLLIFSCRSQRQAVATLPADTVATTTGEAPAKPAGGNSSQRPSTKPTQTVNPKFAAAATALSMIETPWQQLTVPVTVSGVGSMSYSGRLTMVRGRSIDLSFRFFGLEVAAMHIDADSVTAFIKPKRTYVSESIPALLGGFPATIDNLQSLLLGRIFQLGYPSFDPRRCRLDASKGGFTVVPPAPMKGCAYSFAASLAPQRVEGLLVTAPTGSNAMLTYGYDSAPESRACPSQIGVEIKTGKSTQTATLDFDYSRAEWSPTVNGRPFTVPSGYSRLRAASILKMLSGKL